MSKKYTFLLFISNFMFDIDLCIAPVEMKNVE
ncbi:MAG: hypothetical protein ACJAYB_003080 [Psychromonas sp.]|jgi:hypothetical protein